MLIHLAKMLKDLTSLKELFVLSILLFSLSPITAQQETKLVVRAKAKDAKFIGSSIGGALIIIRDAITGEIIESGLTKGSTGDTKLIMLTPLIRGQSIVDESTAKFETSVKIEKPKLIQVDVKIPYSNYVSSVISSTQLWLIPGKHIDGDGLVIEIPGFVIDILNPKTHEFISLDEGGKRQIDIHVNAVMMCGCTISPDGLWDGNKIEVEANIYVNDKLIEVVKLRNDRKNSFHATLMLESSGYYEIVVTAFDPKTYNAGVDKVNFIVE